ncbi:endopeptidase La, partial [uncultured Duncaniella sp.]
MKDEPKIISIGQIDISPDGKQASPTLDDLPVIPLRDMVLFPFITVPIMMGRDLTVRTVNAAVEKKIPVGVFCQTDPGIETPSVSDLNTYGVIADVVKVLELPDGTTTAILSARGKVKILGEGPGETIPGALSVRAKECRETTPRPTDKEFAVLIEDIRSTTLRILGQNGDNSNELIVNIKDLKAPGLMVNMISTHAGFDLSEKMDLLRHSRLKDRAMQLMALIARQEQFFEIRSEIRRKAMKNIDEQQRNHFLQHEFEALREQLYGNDDDSIAFEKKAAALNMPEKVRAAFNKELEKLRRLNPQSPDYSVQYSYLQVLTDLPWNVEDAINADFSEAERTLDRDHYGLEKVKERILEQLAVMMNTPHGRSPIICLVGAPGVGKTSLGQSIARALNRKYQRVSLGGLHDESEIRGHRRTYIGAMPGRIIDAVRRAGSSNPVLLLDEIDKTGNDFKGDPSAALLEVLDPEQNSHFHDNYVDVDYDLSHVLFIATANTLSTIPQPLLDRMEIIDISGYLMEEKIEIARRHLIPRVSKENGFGEDEINFTPEAITKMVEGYTSESGVRQLEKQIAKVVRRIVLRKMRGEGYSLNVTPETLREYLGVERFTPERYEASDHPGVAVGLAWTAVGGEILFIESSFSQAKNEKLTLTGNLGDVMKESAIIASQIVRSYSDRYGIDSEWFDTHALHIHVPEGAIPKDGPSAGITLCT